MSSSSSSSSSSSAPNHHLSSGDPPRPSGLPLREIPGGYGLPFFGPIKDRLDYYYKQGQDEFFKSRMRKHGSTVFKSNMPPGPFMARDPRVVVLLDAVSFPVLFDNLKVEKKDVLDGTYMPSTSLFGGYRPCAFLDPSEPTHATLKGLFLSLLHGWHDKFIPTFRSAMTDLFVNLENKLSDKGNAYFNPISDKMSFDFVFRLFCDKNFQERNNEEETRPDMFDKWLFLQLGPLMTLGLKFVPNCLEDLLLHTFPWPSFLAKSDYQKLYDAFNDSSRSILDEAEKAGLKRDEACHNLVFLAGFNAYGGMKATFPALLKWVVTAGEGFHSRLVEEIRAAVMEEGGVTFSALNKMELTKSTVYEVLRMEPPVPFQYAKAKEDIVVRSHDASYLIKKDEMIFGYQPFAMRDPKIFDDAVEFVGDRFMGEGKELIKYVYWSNGRESDDPTVGNKQCPAKDLVVLLCRLMLVEFFLRYDTFTADTGRILLGSTVTFKSLTKAV